MKTEIKMQGLFEYNGGLYDNIAKIFDYIILSILWLIFSLPIITFGAATSAFYYTTVKVIKRDQGNLLEEFLHAFKINFKDATTLWLIIAVLGFVFQLNIGILSSLTDGNLGLFFISFYIFFFVFLLGVAAYAFPSLSRFEMSAGWILKVSIFMTVRYFPETLALLGILLLSAILIYFVPIFIMIIPTGASILYSYFMEKILIKHTPGNKPE